MAHRQCTDRRAHLLWTPCFYCGDSVPADVLAEPRKAGVRAGTGRSGSSLRLLLAAPGSGGWFRQADAGLEIVSGVRSLGRADGFGEGGGAA